MKIEKICPTCGEPFKVTEATSKYRTYCSLECRNKSYKKDGNEKIYHNCEWCGKTLPQNCTVKYCSAECEVKATRKSAKKRGRKKKVLSLDEVSKLAKAKGLSYGQYVNKYER